MIARLAGRPEVRGIGETGLDFFRTGEDGRAAQERSFRAHIAIAKRFGKALVIHDRDDTTVPFSNGTELAGSWPGAELVETSGLGHSDILRDPTVIAQILQFIKDDRTHRPLPAGVHPDTAVTG